MVSSGIIQNCNKISNLCRL
uniref:Uncharacterized protein n=1 Tax=Anguilla anguilla TaxID=7936 RepID=A0A0E9PZL3_ANGAN